jgi:hypothetical protein
MAFDPKKPHGVVYNHTEIAFVQDGIDYGHDLLPVEVENPKLEANQARSEKMKESWRQRRELEHK